MSYLRGTSGTPIIAPTIPNPQTPPETTFWDKYGMWIAVAGLVAIYLYHRG